MIGVSACREHGALYYQLDVDVNSVVASEEQRPLGDDLPQPVAGEPMTCPKCGLPLEGYLVPDGTFPAPLTERRPHMATSKRELAVWRDRGYDDADNGFDTADRAPMKSDQRAAYFQGVRGHARAKENGDGIVSAQRHRRPLIG